MRHEWEHEVSHDDQECGRRERAGMVLSIGGRLRKWTNPLPTRMGTPIGPKTR